MASRVPASASRAPVSIELNGGAPDAAAISSHPTACRQPRPCRKSRLVHCRLEGGFGARRFSDRAIMTWQLPKLLRCRAEFAGAANQDGRQAARVRASATALRAISGPMPAGLDGNANARLSTYLVLASMSVIWGG